MRAASRRTRISQVKTEGTSVLAVIFPPSVFRPACPTALPQSSAPSMVGCESEQDSLSAATGVVMGFVLSLPLWCLSILLLLWTF